MLTGGASLAKYRHSLKSIITHTQRAQASRTNRISLDKIFLSMAKAQLDTGSMPAMPMLPHDYKRKALVCQGDLVKERAPNYLLDDRSSIIDFALESS
jgi:hypothetical protein